MKIYTGSFEDKLRFVFDLYDFNHSGTINKDDVKLLLLHCPIQKEEESKGFPSPHNYSKPDMEIIEGKLAATNEQKFIK